jgi:regulator of sirC expression with transglutaminase-like and TPR domain
MPSLGAELAAVLGDEPCDLARAALVIAKLECPRLDPAPTILALDRLGREAGDRLRRLDGAPVGARVGVLNALLYDEARFAGNRESYDDFRNSLLNLVVERRTGIPISLAVVYMEVARRAGLRVEGVAFPGHFLLRVPGDFAIEPPVILDPFDRGRELSDEDCRALLARTMGDEAPYDRSLLEPCSSRHLIARMLNNLKRTYVELRSFPQARRVTELLLFADPSLFSELRDRGLLAYHLDDFPAALRDLEEYLRLRTETDRAERDEIWEHVKNLRRRVASLN